ncbi:RNA-guided endonuclease TnpB family protein [Streptomyces sp. NPDC057027]|uniref:RNA-guided endonuclease TnpB family protein n=1 Tax=Streptomyces sp. NPDC057027 TaxID=3346004 RepID=UPI00363B4728
MTVSPVKRAFKYRFRPTGAQADELSRTFGCVRKVYNLALAARTEAWARQERVNYNATSAMLTAWKKTEELAFHARIADRRRDGLHKLTTRLVRENQTLVIEDLTVRTMVRNRSLARAISDAAWLAFRSMLEYKAAWYGREVIAADRFFPSSKLCSHCGRLAQSMPLHVRTWTCEGCGTTHDRDVNAAKNLKAAGLAVSVCGAGVRPRRRTPGGQPAPKQKTPRRKP